MIKLQLRKPDNWQDFESLCKILWGEIWTCNEIKKNGRNGQNQNGVDIYGVPLGENEYFGIQCKAKDLNSNSKLSKKEINSELEKAKYFKPKLKKLYIATTANKDSEIEEYVRVLNQEYLSKNEFEIHLFCWEDIVDLIDENKRTYDWYIKNIKFKNKHSVDIKFENGKKHISFSPKIIRRTYSYNKALSQNINQNITNLILSRYPQEPKNRKQLGDPQPISHFINGSRINLSASKFRIIIENNGDLSLENYKLNLYIKNANINIEVASKKREFFDNLNYDYNVFVNGDLKTIHFEPTKDVLVLKDSVKTDYLCLCPTYEETQTINIDYEFLSKDFICEGKLVITIENNIVDKTEYVDDESDCKITLENLYT